MDLSTIVPLALRAVSPISGEINSARDSPVENSLTSPVRGLSTSDSDSPVVLQVGERRFHTSRSTLVSGSLYFRSLFSGDFADPRSEDGSYFVDADPEAFSTILKYLRHDVLPTFFDKTQRFDHDLCRAVQAEALFFGIDKLISWIRDKEYLKCFTTLHEVEERLASMSSGSSSGAIGVFQGTVEPNTEQTYSLSKGSETVYTCPRNMQSHDENPGRCGRQCQNARRDLEATGGTCYVEREVVRVLVVTKRTVFRNI